MLHRSLPWVNNAESLPMNVLIGVHAVSTSRKGGEKKKMFSSNFNYYLVTYVRVLRPTTFHGLFHHLILLPFTFMPRDDTLFHRWCMLPSTQPSSNRKRQPVDRQIRKLA